MWGTLCPSFRPAEGSVRGTNARDMVTHYCVVAEAVEDGVYLLGITADEVAVVTLHAG